MTTYEDFIWMSPFSMARIAEYIEIKDQFFFLDFLHFFKLFETFKEGFETFEILLRDFRETFGRLCGLSRLWGLFKNF